MTANQNAHIRKNAEFESKTTFCSFVEEHGLSSSNSTQARGPGFSAGAAVPGVFSNANMDGVMSTLVLPVGGFALTREAEDGT